MRKLFVLFTSIFVVCYSYAAPPSEESINTLLAATKAEKLVDGMLSNVDQMMRQSMVIALKGQKLSLEQQRDLDKISERFANILREELAWKNMRSTYIQIYKESFSQDEINGLIDFYRSPTGEAFVEKMPVVMQKSMAYTQSRITPMMQKMDTAIRESIATGKASNPPTKNTNSDMENWARAIRTKIKANLNLPPDTPKNARVVCGVTQLPSGEIQQIKLVSSSGIQKVDAAVLIALQKSSPLPKPSQPGLFQQEIQVVWKNDD